MVGDAFADPAQQAVAGEVTEAVVDVLEPVEVNDRDREAIVLAALRQLDRVARALQEQLAVGQAGQRIVQCVVDQALLGLLALGDVGL